MIALIVGSCFGATGSPYYRVDAGPVISVGRSAAWSVTTVRVRHSNWFQWAGAVVSGGRTVRGASGPAPTAADHAMETSQTYAALVAAQLAAGRPPLGRAGVQVVDVPAAARSTGLGPGDVLLAADRAPISTVADLPVRTGSVRFLVVRKTSTGWGAAETVRLPASQVLSLRVSPVVNAVTYPLAAVQGPSAGLMLTLARIDDLTPGDLTGGRRIAGTGAISLDGSITTVGEVAEKVRAATAARIQIFFVPRLQAPTARAAAHGHPIRVVPVDSVPEALQWLCTTGAHSPACRP